MKTLQDLLGPARDQGDRETCLSMALSDGHRGAVPKLPSLAVDFLHFHAASAARASINDPVPVSAGLTALATIGQPAEVECPYSGLLRAADWKPSPPVGGAWRHETLVKSDDLWASILSHLDAKKPVVLIMHIDDPFWNPVAGVVETAVDPRRASHAVLALAYSLNPDRVLVRNSWGQQWGDGGHAWLSSSYLAARCKTLISFEGAIV